MKINTRLLFSIISLVLVILIIDANISFSQSISEGKEFYFGLPYAKMKEPDPLLNNLEYPIYVYVLSQNYTHITLYEFQSSTTKYLDIQANNFVGIGLSDFYMNKESEVVNNYGYYLKSDKPVSVYLFYSYALTGEMCNILPLEALGKEYRSLNLYQDFTDDIKPAQILITATENNTSLTYIPTYDTEKCGIGQERTITLMNGETFLILGKIQEYLSLNWSTDLSGTYIKANKPVSVISGHTKGTYPLFPIGNVVGENAYREMLCESMIPLEQLGTEYISIPFSYEKDIFPFIEPYDNKGDLIRFVATEDSTKIYKLSQDGSVLNPISITLNKGEWHLITNQENAAYYKSNKPVLVGQYGKTLAIGQITKFSSCKRGMLINLIPINKWATSASFYSIPNANNYMTLTFDHSNLDKLYLDGKKIINYGGSCNNIQGTNYSYYILIVTSGPHFIESKNGSKFACYFYGDELGYTIPNGYLGAGFSYGSQSCYNFGSLCNDTVSFIEPENTGTCGNVNGSIAALDIDTGSTCATLYSIDTLDTYNYNLSLPDTFKRGDVSVSYQLSVINPQDSATATIEVIAGSGKKFYRTLKYYPEILSPDIQIHDFGRIAAGSPVTKSIVLRNNSNSNTTLQKIYFKNKSAEFEIISPTEFPIIIQPGDSVNLQIRAKCLPGSKEYVLDSLIADLSCYSQTLTHFSMQSLKAKANTTNLVWDKAPVGVEYPKTFTISNTGEIDVQITSIDWSDKQHFTKIVPDGFEFPCTIKPGYSASVKVYYKPDQIGSVNLDTAIIGNGSNLQLYSIWSGKGIDPMDYRLTLVSPPNNSTGVAIDTLLTWQPLTTDYSYNINIAKDDAFSDIKSDTNCTKPQYQATLDINTQYYWRVRVTIPEVEFTWSDTWSFVTGDKSGVQPISPVNELEIKVIPNPSFGSVKIVYNLPEPGTVSIKIMDMLGSTVFEPVHDFYSAGGEHILDYDCSRLSSGVYFISIRNGGRVATMRWCVIQ